MEGQSKNRAREDDSDTEPAQRAKRQLGQPSVLTETGRRLLSFDGSETGTTELEELLLIKEIMERIQGKLDLDEIPRPFQYFDLIGGTGVGGIFAIFFALWHLSADEAIEAYLILHKDVFTSDAWRSNDAEAAERLFKQAVHDIASKHGKNADITIGTTKLSLPGCKGFLCTLDPVNPTHPLLFCTYLARANRTPTGTVTQALTASIAGYPHLEPLSLGLPPTKFISANSRFINPTSILLKQALEVFGPSQHVACVVSLGSGRREPSSIPTNRAADSSGWAKLAQDAEQSVNDMAGRCGDTKDLFFRLNVTHDLKELPSSLDSLSIVASHTGQYLRQTVIGHGIDRLVRVLCERPAYVTTERLNSIIGPDARDKILDVVKEIRVSQVETGLSIEKTEMHVELERLNTVLSPVRKAMIKEESPVPLRTCTEGTRSAILDEITRWAMDHNDNKVYCLNGMAGTGKTTIGSTLIQILAAACRLGGIFYCSRADEDCGDARKIAPTIAYQLARRIPAIRDALTPLLSDSMIEHSFHNLIVKPLEKATESGSIQHLVVIVIDALDECSSRSYVQRLLNDILSMPSTLPIKFFVTFRPEHEFLSLLRRPNDALHRFHLHEVEKSFVENDIRLYLRERLDRIAQQRLQCGVDHDFSWPPFDQVEELVAQSGRLFIYAATACEYIGGCSGGSVVERLLSIISIGRDKTAMQTEKIDILYRGILSKAFDGLEGDEAVRVTDILRLVITAQTPLKIDALAKLLSQDSRHRIYESMLSLHSVIHIPLHDGPITTFHASFPDFLTNESRAGVRYLPPAESSLFLANRCFGVMSSLHENMCDIDGRPANNEIEQSVVEGKVHDALAYACQHWIHHCCSSGTFADRQELHHPLAEFFLRRNLPWIECLSLRGNFYETVRMLRILESWVSTDGVDIRLSVKDTRRFISQNIELLTKNAMETYFSALVWLPRKSHIRERFFRGRGLPEICGGLDKDWDRCEMILGGHSGSVRCVAISPDGGRIVTGSGDSTARVWNMSTGEQELELAGHSSLVNCAAFSPDGSRIVTGSDESTALVWNTSTGEQEHELVGHSEAVYCAAFSPDGGRIVTGSGDSTARVWNTSTGEQEHELVGHSGGIMCAAFSPDGGRIVTGSSDSTARVWNMSTGEQEHEMVGHSGSVRCVAISPDGGRIVTVSNDSTARVWNMSTGEQEHELAGHSSRVNYVAFSPDGSRIVTGSWDDTARVWNTSTGEQEHELAGHSDPVYCVAISPDGSRIVTGSNDSTARVWNMLTGEQEHEMVGHSDGVSCVAYSPDGRRIVTGSWDTTARVWNTSTGEQEHELLGHSGIISCVALSPDGRRIVTGSGDSTARVWNTSTGEQEHELFGHSDGVSCVAYSPDGRRIVTGSWDRTARVWNTSTGEQEHELFGHSGIISCVALSPDGRRIITGSNDSTARVWNTSTGEQEHELAGHSDSVNCVAYSPDGRRIITGSDDSTARVWNTSTGEQEHELAGHLDWVNCVAFSPDGSRIVTGSWDNEIRVYHTGAQHFNILQDDAHHILGDGSFICRTGIKAGFVVKSPDTPSLSVSSDHCWLTLFNPNVRLWVPMIYRNFKSCDIRGSSVVFGYASGKVLWLTIQ